MSWQRYRSGQVFDDVAEVSNAEFNSERFDVPGVVAGGVQYQLAGFPADHEAWNEGRYSQRKTCKTAVIDDPHLVERASVHLTISCCDD